MSDTPLDIVLRAAGDYVDQLEGRRHDDATIATGDRIRAAIAQVRQDHELRALSDGLERLERLDAGLAREFEQRWAFALSAVETGGERHLIDGELSEMVAELDQLVPQTAGAARGAQSA